MDARSTPDTLIDLLRCPFCGGRFNLADGPPTVRAADGRLDAGILWCECCAFPVVAGIPVLRADDITRATMAQIEAGRLAEALETLLGLDESRVPAFRALTDRADATYREAIAILSPDPEGTYFVYRFSDPTFVMAEAVVRALAEHPRAMAGPVLDLCGGSGHLTRVLTGVRPDSSVVLADMFFWKLWLARTFVAPQAIPVCCDANQPLPFERATFGTVVLSDAFPYIWHKRLLADEMVRQAGASGLIVMPHLHSSLGWNYSAGMTLTPRSYADLFAALEPRLFADEALLTQAIEGNGIDLSSPLTPEALGDANSFTLVATADASVFRRYERPAQPPVQGELIVNPLYCTESTDDGVRLTLTFPTPEYADEFADCRRYLPDTLDLPEPQNLRTSEPQNLRTSEPQNLRTPAPELLRRRILIDAPPRYC